MVSTSIPVPKYNCINTRVVIFYKKKPKNKGINNNHGIINKKSLMSILPININYKSQYQQESFVHALSIIKKYEHVSTIYLHVSTTPNVNYSVNNNIQQQSKLKEKYKEKQFKDMHVLSTPVVYRCSNKTIGHLSY